MSKDPTNNYLYVDGAQVRALLADHTGGLVDQEVETKGDDQNWQRDDDWTQRSLLMRSQIRSFEETQFRQFMKKLGDDGYITDITELASDSDAWYDGRIAKSAPENSIIKITANCQFIDGQYFADNMSQFGEAYASALKANGKLNNRNRSKKNPEVRKFKELLSVIKTMHNEGLTVRIEPCPDDNDAGFVGQLVQNNTYMEQDREAFHLRYGSEPRKLTVVGLITRYARESHDVSMPDVGSVVVNGFIMRGRIAQFQQKVSSYMENTGWVEGPKSPGAAIIPIAIYQQVHRPPGSQT